MNLTSRVSHPSATTRPRAADLLGARHPLVRDIERLDIARTQCLIVAGGLALGVVGVVAHSAAGIALIVAAALSELLIACRIAVLLASRRVSVLELIAQDHAALPIPIVERTCARLSALQHRQRMVQTIETLLDPRPHGFDRVVTPWQFVRSELVAGVRQELRAISILLVGPDTQVQGVAMMERLLSDGTSCLHGDDPRLLDEELRRVRFLLQAHAPEA